MAILETKNLKKHFAGVNALDELDISVPESKITAVVGPNGSGKTTLLNILSGLLNSDGGKIVIAGESLQKIKPYNGPLYGLTRTFQDVRLFNQMSVLDNLLVVITERNVLGSMFERHQKHHLMQVEKLLRATELWEKRNSLAMNLSYGQRKLLEIARVLAMDTKIILLDEPFAGLSPVMTEKLCLLIKNMREERKSVILIEHNMKLIRELADYLIVMDEGKLLAEGNPKEVLKKREVMEAYLGV